MMKFLPNLYLYLFSAFCFSIPFTDFGEAIPNILLGATGLLFFISVKKSDFQKLNALPMFIFIGLIVLILIQTIILNRGEDFSFLTRLLIVPAILVLQLPISNYKPPLYAFLIGAFTLLIISVSHLLYLYLNYGEIDFATGDFVNQQMLGERPYLGFVCVIAFCLSIYFGKLNYHYNKKLSVLFYTLSVVFIGFVVFISARISFLSIIAVLFIYLINLKNKKIRYGLLIGFLLILSGVFIVNKDLKKRFFITENSYTMEEMLKFEPRYYIWTCSTSLIKEKPFWGWGFVTGQDQLKECFSKRKNFLNIEQQDYFVRSRFNTHNQFLNFFLSNGIICFILFVFFFAIILFKNRKNYYILSLLITLFLFCLVENVLSRQMGAMLFGIVYIFSYFLSQDLEEVSS